MPILSKDAIKIAYYDKTTPPQKAKQWEARLRAYLPNLEFTDLLSRDADDAQFALVWQPPSGRLATLPQLRLILSLGQGVDHLFSDAALPTDIPICRIVDAQMSVAMGHWVISCLLDHIRHGPAYRAQAAKRIWSEHDQPDIRGIRVGIYGIGAIGAEVARQIAALHFCVYGWSRTPKQIEGIECLSGADGWQEMLTKCQIHICLLALTDATRGLFDEAAFAKMPAESYVINGGRGGHIVEADLLAAIKSNHLAGAALDVFATEPLAENHGFWAEPRIAIFPHVAAQTEPNTAAQQIAEAVMAVLDGRLPTNQVSVVKGY